MNRKKFNMASDIHISGSIMAEFPSDEETNPLSFPNKIPVFPLFDNVTFPGLPQPVAVTDPHILDFLENMYENKSCVLAVAVKDMEKEPKKLRDFFPFGTICKIGKILKMPDMDPVVFLMSGPRVRLKKISEEEGHLMADVSLSSILAYNDSPANQFMLEKIREFFKKLSAFLQEEDRNRLNFQMEDVSQLPDRGVFFMINNSPLTNSQKGELLSSKNYSDLLESLLGMFDLALQQMELQASIQMRTHQELSSQQRTHFLKQQLQNIREELGETDESDSGKLRERGKKMCWSKETKAHFEKELVKLERFNPSTPDYSTQYAYLDTLLSLPWDNYSPDNFALSKVEKILDRDHYGLEKVKERILEHMAVIKLRNDMKSPIICLYGPPGVGKTSLGRSIADSLGREYARVSLGGVHDEAEIRGHRRTYIGAMPGRIISALQKCGKGNPVFVLDEIDKIGKDFKGDPSTALLEVLDPEQNSKFHDNYLDIDYDLSRIMFIATANSLSDISRPLLDRMEIIEIGGYIPEEKVEIAKRHLVPKTLTEHGFEKDELKFTPEALLLIIDKYTRESGVRQLEKKIAKVLRKIARLKAAKKDFPHIIGVREIKDFLGAEEVRPELYENNRWAGVVTGLAWTQVGGEILFIESSLSKGNGEKLTLTGNLGDVMKESAVIALQYLKAHAGKLGIDPSLFEKVNVHIHVPEGAIPKDGPSAGITMATSLASAFTGRKVREKIAMTGEITLRGKVLPVGGIKEKILAAKRAGITDIILSTENRRDIEEINARYLKGLEFHYADTVDDVLSFALLQELAENRFELC